MTGFVRVDMCHAMIHVDNRRGWSLYIVGDHGWLLSGRLVDRLAFATR